MTIPLYPIARVKVGDSLTDTVTANRLNSESKNFEAIGNALSNQAENFIQDIGAAQDADGEVSALPNSATVTEVSRTTSAVVVTDSNGDTFTLNVTTQIVATGTWSDGSPLTITMNLATPS